MGAMDDVSPLYMPSKSQEAMWWHLVMVDDGVDQDGYWLGWCAIHGREQDTEIATAQYNFRKGVMRCLGEPSCHEGKRVVSLTNVLAMVQMGGSGG